MSSNIAIDWFTGALAGEPVKCSDTKFARLKDLFLDRVAAAAMDQEHIIYRVQYWMPIPEGTAGGLFWGTTVIEPGRIGDEYFMTHGHLHKERDRAEYYATIRGEGALILMNGSHTCRFEEMRPGTVHYIPGYTAHRVANTGAAELAFLGCWPSDAGHDYDVVTSHGFSARMREVNGKPKLIPDDRTIV